MKTLEVELIRSGKTLRPTAKPPKFWAYTAEYARAKKALYEIDGTRFFFGTSPDFKRLASQLDHCIELEETIFKLTEPSSWTEYLFVITPDGQVFVRERYNSTFFKTVVKAPELGEPGWAWRYMSDISVADGDEYHKPEWAKIRRLINTLEEKLFPEGWKKARRAWVSEQKKNGNWEKAQKQRKAKKLAEKTNRKMAVCNQVTDLIEDLESYLSHINDGTATQREVGRIYDQMMKLASMNKKVKTLFPKDK